MSRERIKREAKRLQKLLPAFVQQNAAPFPLSACQELAAKAAGFNDFHSVPKETEDAAADAVRRDIEGIRSQLAVAISAVIARGTSELDFGEIDWDEWLTLVDVHDELSESSDIFAWPSLAASTATRLYMNPFDLDALGAAVHLHNFTSFTDAEPLIVVTMEHVLKVNMMVDAFNEEEGPALDEVLEIIQPKATACLFASYLMMAAIEQGNAEKAAQTCQMALMIDERGDERGILMPGICCAFEADDVLLAVNVFAAIFGSMMVSAEVIQQHAAQDDSTGVAVEASIAGVIELLMGLEVNDWDVPAHQYAIVTAVHKVASDQPERYSFSDVVPKPIVDEDGICPEDVDVPASLVLAAARYVARDPERMARLTQILQARPKLH